MPRFVGTGNNTLLNSGGTLDSSVLPKASTTNYGIVQIGAGLSVANGVISIANNSSGTVTSVALSAPTIFSVAGSPVTSSGTLDINLVSQASNLVFAGPVSGATPALPTFRALVAADIPSLDAAKISSGTVASARLPAATASTAGVIRVGTGLTISNGILSADLDLNNTTTTVAPNRVLAGPTSGGNAIASFRALVGSDLPVATASTLGAIKIGTGLSINSGVLSADVDLNNTTTTVAANRVLAGPATGSNTTPTFRTLVGSDLPAATASTLGAIKIGSGLTISNGVLSADLDLNNTTTVVPAGQILAGPISGSNTTAAFRTLVGSDLPVATASTLGAVKVGSGLEIISDVLSSNFDLIANTVTTAPNLILAGPSTGATNATPTFRALAEADIPNLPASKITSGTVDSNLLPVATDTVAGVVKVGSGLSITDGILSVTGVPSGGGGGEPSGGGTGGSVTSVGLSAPTNIFNVSGSPVSTSGTLALSLDHQAANTVFAGPAGGGTAEPVFRVLSAGDIPNISADKLTSGVVPVSRGGTGLGALGYANQVLKVNSSGNGLEYGAATSGPQLGSNRQTVLSGPSSGSYASCLTSGTGLTVGINGSVTPVELSFADGFSSGPLDYYESISTNASDAWTLPANATSYLYVERTSAGQLAYGSTQTKPVYGDAGAYYTQLVVEVYDYHASTNPGNHGASLNEIAITLDTGSGGPQTLTYTVSSTEAYDSRTNGVPFYWNHASYFNKSNLNDNATSYSTTNSTLFMYGPTEPSPARPGMGDWARFLITLSNSLPAGGVTLTVNLGDTAGHTPVTVSVYAVTGTYNKAQHLNVRTNTGLTLLGSVSPGGDITTATEYTVFEDKSLEVAVEDSFKFNIQQMKMYKQVGDSLVNTNVVFVGEATTNATSVTSLVSYAYRGFFIAPTQIHNGSNTSYRFDHNLGCLPLYFKHFGMSSATANEYNEPLHYATSTSAFHGSALAYVGTLSAYLMVKGTGVRGYNLSGTTSTASLAYGRIIVSRGW